MPRPARNQRAAHPPTPQRRPEAAHTALRPLWLCRACAAPWPCAFARLTLRQEYAHDKIGLHVYLCAVLHEATADLYRLHPHDGPDPRSLFDRFLGWVRGPGPGPGGGDHPGPA
ncbi:hypothetical protein [Micromonospora sp. KC207]|uniref:hypothetical protein n=1 Tax=Micromonospora sp. KC207 TaxID=2530377 RepID=UPI001FB5E59A|nr:hypothetical protein [Micromonospora sp. KC207]